MNDPIDPRPDRPDRPEEPRPMNPEESRRTEPTEHRDMSNSEPVPAQSDENTRLPWLAHGDIDELRSHWTSIQSQFVDQPCTAIEQADALVADAVERIQKLFTDRQNELRDRWIQRDDASTEELRLALQEYRSFLNSILDH